MDIEKLAVTAINKSLTENGDDIINKQADTLLKNIFADIFSPYGELGKSIKAKIQSELDMSLDGLQLRDYTSLMADSITKMVTEQYIKVQQEDVTKILSETLGKPFPKKVLLTDIVELFKQCVMDDADGEYAGDISYHVERESKYDWTHVYLDAESEKSIEDCDYTLMFSNGSLISIRMNTIYGDRERMSLANADRFNKFDMYVLRLKSARKVSIELDTDNVDTYWSFDE